MADEHDHDHDHDASAPPPVPETGGSGIADATGGAPDQHDDPAGESLADALRVSFGILKLAMVVLIVLFIFSGLFEVEQNQVGVRVQLGQIHGEPGEQVLEPGWYFAFPAPIDETLVIPTQSRDLEIDEAFWFNERPDEITKPLDQKTPQQQLTPGVDGSLLTGDRNVVHGKFTVTYRIGASREGAGGIDHRRVLAFVRNVSADPDPDAMLNAAEHIMSAAAEHGIIRLAAQVEADRFIAGLDDQLAVAKKYMQDQLDAVGSGITVMQVQLRQPIPPLVVRGAFDAVSANEQNRAAAIDKARQNAAELLSAAAGPAYPAMLVAIDAYETARRIGDEKRTEAAANTLAMLLEGATARDALAGIADDPSVDPAKLRAASTDATVESAARAMINSAVSYRTVRKQQVDGEIARFKRSHAAYQKSPRIVLNQLWETVRQEILASKDVESFYLPDNPDKALYLEINRDPEIQKRREEAIYKKPEN